MTKALRRGIFPAIGWNVAAAAGQQGATLLQTLILANILGPSGFGIFSIGSLAMVSLSWLTTAGLGLTTSHFVARAEPGLDPSSVARACLIAGGLISVTGGLLLASLRSPLALQLYGLPEAVMPLTAAGVGLPLITIGIIQASVMVGLGAFKVLGIVSLVQMPFQLALTAGGAVLAGPEGALVALLGVLALRLLLNAFVIRTLLPRHSPPISAARTLKAMRAFAIPAGIVNLTMAPAIWLPTAVLARVAGPAEVGMLAVALLIRTAIVFLPQQMGAILLQGYGALRAEPREARQFGFKMIRMGTAAVAVIAVVVLLLGELVPVLFGEGFALLAELLPLIVVGATLEGVAQLCSYMVASQNRMWRSFFLYSTPRDVLLVILAFLLAPAFGVAGVLWAHVISWAVALAMALFLVLSDKSDS